MNIRKTITDNWAQAKVVLRNVVEFVDAAALAAVSGYSIHMALKHRTFWNDLLLFAGCLIALQAFVLLVKHFNKSN